MNKPKIVAVFLACLLLFGTAGFSIAADESAPSGLEALVAEALAKNPDLKAAEARWRMYERKIVPAGSLDDPQLSFAFSNYPVDSLRADETPMTGNDLKISQKFPFPGKLASKEEMAEQQALWFKGVYEDARLQLGRKVKDAYYRLFFQDRAIEIIRMNIDVLDDFIRLTETRYAVGKGLQQDVLKAQVERSKLMDRLFTLKQQRETALADLNTLLARPSTTPYAPPAEITPTDVAASLDELQAESQQRRPLYAAYDAVVERFKVQRKLARLDYWPDFNVFAGYRFREDSDMDPVEGTDFVSAGVSINLPIYRKKRAEAVAEADSGLRMAYEQYNDFRNKVYFNVHDAYAQMEKNRDLVLLFKTGIVPQANQTFQSALAAYQVGETDFLTLLDALLKLYLYEMDYYRALADYQRSVAKLEAESGVGFNAAAPAKTENRPGER